MYNSVTIDIPVPIPKLVYVSASLIVFTFVNKVSSSRNVDNRWKKRSLKTCTTLALQNLQKTFFAADYLMRELFRDAKPSYVIFRINPHMYNIPNNSPDNL